jgi:hypothetical protein
MYGHVTIGYYDCSVYVANPIQWEKVFWLLLFLYKLTVITANY